MIGTLAKLYQRQVSKSLRQLGLRYDDALVEVAEVNKAVTWLGKEEKIARQRRLVRASDLSFKRAYLPEDIQAIQEPLNFYLDDKVEEVRKLGDERNKLTKW
ncbi:hypothetical protein ACHHYP_07182 [Achlya hypogyna]|uniref:Cytochrome b-c1 complex subunit 7 n=1 Tax=Achlya hypogyna TaxID=1202772 RepID=A0A1V9ZMK3_ACHHY|nr:hypothetical protein ACHHYP_07182 [Achlya hypogyna]